MTPQPQPHPHSPPLHCFQALLYKTAYLFGPFSLSLFAKLQFLQILLHFLPRDFHASLSLQFFLHSFESFIF